MKIKDLDPEPELDPTWIHRIRMHNTDIFLIQESGEDKEFMAVRKSLPAWDKRHEIIRSAVKKFLIHYQNLFLRIFIFPKIRDFFALYSYFDHFFLLYCIWESCAISSLWCNIFPMSSNPVTSAVYCCAAGCLCDDWVLKIEKNINNFFTQKQFFPLITLFQCYLGS